MLIKNYKNSNCPFSYTGDGDCCCNCIHRHLLLVEGMPITFMCNLKIDGKIHMINIGHNGHSLCEMHQREGQIPIEKLNII